MTIFRNYKQIYNFLFWEQCAVVWFRKKEKKLFPKNVTAYRALDVRWMQVLWHLGNRTSPPFESVLTLHHRKRKKKCQATPYVVVVQDGSSLRSQIHNLCHSELLNTQIATKNLLNDFYEDPILSCCCRLVEEKLEWWQICGWPLPGERVMSALRARSRRALLFCFLLWDCWKVKAPHCLHSDEVSSMVDILQKWSEKIHSYLKQ